LNERSSKYTKLTWIFQSARCNPFKLR
jgi:hypothetical protein